MKLSVSSPTGDGTAVTQSASGGKSVLRSSLPLETENAAGEQQPVDLSLASDSTGFRTRNAFVDLRIAKRSHEGVSFPQGGFSISPGGQATTFDSGLVRPFGPAAGPDPDVEKLALRRTVYCPVFAAFRPGDTTSYCP